MSKVRILIVEDEGINAMATKGRLEDLGYEVTGIVASGEEAIEISKKELPDLILMDIKLEGEMTGIEAAEIINEKFNIPVVYLTAHSDPATLEQAKESVQQGYIVKPPDEKDLAIAIECALYRDKVERQKTRDRELLISELSSSLEKEITERVMTEQRLERMAKFDDLTELLKRESSILHLVMLLKIAKKHKTKVALLMVGLDDFKMINETLGHEAGDLILKQSAGIFKTCLRSSDSFEVVSDKEMNGLNALGRWGSDEFMLNLASITDVRDVEVVIKRIINAFETPFVINGKEYHISCNIGAAIYPDDCFDADSLIKYADIALAKAKSSNRVKYKFFSHEMSNEAVRQLRLKNDLRKAIENTELFLMYQPQVDLGAGRIIGMEALVRWKHGEYDFVPPSEFISIAEQDPDLMMRIGEWILYQACKQAKTWQNLDLPPVLIAVNVSPIQLLHPDFAGTVKRILNQTVLSPEYLDIEITESHLINDTDKAIDHLKLLSEIGVSISIDDFGKGYSSFSHIKNLPAKQIKIDMEFVRGICVNCNNEKVTRAIISMAHELDFNSLAEGIEQPEQALLLKNIKCMRGQGYLFSKPLSADAATELLGKGVVYRISE